MPLNLTKGQSINLAEAAGKPLSQVVLGLGWEPAGSNPKGFLKTLLSGNNPIENIDLDASCLVFDTNGALVETIYFGNLRSHRFPIRHSGDNLTGHGGKGDKEQIFVDLGAMPASVKTLVFTVNSFRGQTFDMVENAYVRLCEDSVGGMEAARFSLTDKGTHTGLILAKVYRSSTGWKIQALGEQARGTRAQDMLPAIAQYL